MSKPSETEYLQGAVREAAFQNKATGHGVSGGGILVCSKTLMILMGSFQLRLFSSKTELVM